MGYETSEWVRIRNLRISISKGIIVNNWENKRTFSELELRNVFCFKASDLAYYAKKFFKRTERKYTLLDTENVYINKILYSYKTAKPLLIDADARFLAEFGSFCNEYLNNKYVFFTFEKYNDIEENVKEILPVLHWGHLPILNKYLLHNRGIDPETRTVDFYCHFDCLKAMLDEIKGDGQIMQNHSDNTLDKELIFEVYTRRWKHSDRYKMKRTIDGWLCSHVAINGKCRKSGEGALFNNLNHDSVFFPEEAVKYAMEELWESADEGEIDLAELQKRLQQVADWISHVEKAVGEKQPDWVNYF